ncbi:hypothetical protein BcDW1_3641 [Botrytis cinerea BcDW1]|uniref:Uncharacterized protein n=1 Tax=Botryotinia fuckeliana (strain BcDW1) TaxID=1290391 RepID=M7TVR6_BOTF1|nr:hypothetical protein BcDW1_3641 [Botrytis cinerea BcDW1]
MNIANATVKTSVGQFHISLDPIQSDANPFHAHLSYLLRLSLSALPFPSLASQTTHYLIRASKILVTVPAKKRTREGSTNTLSISHNPILPIVNYTSGSIEDLTHLHRPTIILSTTLHT